MSDNAGDKPGPGGQAHAGCPIIVAGHLCLDIAPDLSERRGAFSKSIEPGQLINTGPAKIGPGGCVANTGLAVLRLGQTVRLLGKIGADGFGDAIRRSLEERKQGLGDWLHVARDEASSYTLVFDPPDEDRMFFHYPGVNDTFSPADVQAVLDAQRGARPGIFHFGI
ncbi:MAG: carbohydrate kinase family protein [Thermoplasmatota archaeon]